MLNATGFSDASQEAFWWVAQEERQEGQERPPEGDVDRRLRPGTGQRSTGAAVVQLLHL